MRTRATYTNMYNVIVNVVKRRKQIKSILILEVVYSPDGGGDCRFNTVASKIREPAPHIQ